MQMATENEVLPDYINEQEELKSPYLQLTSSLSFCKSHNIKPRTKLAPGLS